MSPATATLVKIAEGVTRDLYRMSPERAREYVELMRANATKATTDAHLSQRQSELDRACAKWAEVRAAEQVLAEMAGGAS